VSGNRCASLAAGRSQKKNTKRHTTKP